MQSSSRNGAQVVWLGVHTTEGIMRAADLLAWTSWAGSSHASNDETGVLLTPADGFVAYDRSAWTLRNGNAISENIEQCGWARWTRAEWLARPQLLDTTARWLADRSKARGIPLRRLSDAEIRNRVPGVLGHGDYSRATGDGTHTDPGPNYPWDVVLDKARAYAAGTPASDEEIDMSARDDIVGRQDGRIIPGLQRIEASSGAILGILGPQILGKIDALTEIVRQHSGGTDVDVDAIVSRVTQGVTASVLGSVAEVVRAELGEDNTVQADAIVARLSERLAS